MENEINHIIKTFGKRDPGSKGEKDSCDYMAQQLKEYGCDDVKVEPFEVHPTAFMGWIYITVSLVLAAFVLVMVNAFVLKNAYVYIAPLAMVLIGAIIMICEFVMYRQLVDKLFPAKTSYNVTAVKKPTGEVKRRIFFNGHPDAAYEWTVNYWCGGLVFVMHVLYSMMGLVYLFAVALIALINEATGGTAIAASHITNMCWAILMFVPAWLLMFHMSNERQIVDGANDNLTGCYMGIAIMKALKEQGIELENTEVGVLISGSEEAGLRGAKAWTKAHKDDYNDVETLIMAFDTIHEGRFLMVNDLDLNGTVKADKKIADMFVNAAKKQNVTINRGTVPLGATDSAGFNHGGFKAVGITAMDHNLQDYYHTRKDTIGNLDLVGLADCFAATVQTLEDYENE
jgi:hypothetical protein